MEKLPLSVAIISFNEEENLARTLESVVGIASEIIIVDSHSTDKTVEIAESFGAKVFIEDWKGHVAQKNSALDKCVEPWVLSLDCDEVLTDELRQSVIDAVNTAKYDGYELNRRTFYCGKFLKYSWQPDMKLRLVKLALKPEWGGYDPHDSLKLQGKIGKLKGDLLHYSYKDILDHYQRLVKYSKTAAESYHKNGKKFRVHKMLLNPLASFLKKYVFRFGFMDGLHGLIVAVSSFIYVFLKYLFLWEIERDKK
jgi:glycosyltransferase involved in cell wall biosynthesis